LILIARKKKLLDIYAWAERPRKSPKSWPSLYWVSACLPRLDSRPNLPLGNYWAAPMTAVYHGGCQRLRAKLRKQLSLGGCWGIHSLGSRLLQPAPVVPCTTYTHTQTHFYSSLLKQPLMRRMLLRRMDVVSRPHYWTQGPFLHLKRVRTFTEVIDVGSYKSSKKQQNIYILLKKTMFFGFPILHAVAFYSVFTTKYYYYNWLCREAAN